MRVLRFICYMCVVLLLGGACGNNQPAVSPSGSPSTELPEMVAPASVEPQLWQQLKDELSRVLAATEGYRVVSNVPQDKRSQVTDLAAVPSQSSGATFFFSYRCTGDYDQNGEVNAADLTPIAIHFNKTTASPDWAAARVADGDMNGLINIADITPIAQNFHVHVEGYQLEYASSATADSWQAAASISQPDGVLPPAGGFRQYSLLLDSPANQMYYRVVPFEEGASRLFGIPSNVAYFGTDMLLAPENVQASDGVYQDRVYVTWTKTVGATGYQLFRDSQSAPLTLLGDVDHYDDTAVPDTAPHQYWVKASNSTQVSNFSVSDTGYLAPPVSGALQPPTSVQATDGVFENRIYVSWEKAANATGYQVFRDSQSAPLSTVGNVAFYNDTSVSDYFQHTYWVKAIDDTHVSDLSTPDTGFRAAPTTGTMVVLAWNDLGMHCMNQDFSELMILPPYNTFHAQVISKAGDSPQIITSGVTVRYTIPENTHSADKCNFWDYAAALLGSSPAPNIGLTGHGLAGTMDPLQLTAGRNDWSVTGIPITPINDAGLEDPYNLATVTVQSGTSTTARTQAVVPVSWEISCDLCHFAAGGSPASDILQKHDILHGTDLSHAKPVLCGSCHAQPPLGLTGTPGVPSLSSAMHTSHSSRMAAAGLPLECYACHPGQRTQCLRDVMYSAGKNCHDCHGTMIDVGNPLRAPWADEPRCGDCHNVAGHEYEQPGVLYRDSIGHNGVHCAACHGSPHAITPTVVADDNVQAIALQGHAGTIDTCTVCHSTPPDDPFNHTAGEGEGGGD
jgi:hypothetical protein